MQRRRWRMARDTELESLELLERMCVDLQSVILAGTLWVL